MPNSVKKPLVGSLAVLLLIAAAAALFVKSRDNTTQNGLNAGTSRRAAPQFELVDARGRTRKLSESRGRAVLLHFWAQWCPPCLDEIPKVLALAESYKGRPLDVWMVTLDPTWDDAHKILPSEKLPSNMISVLDVDQKVADQYGSYQYPETYLLDAEQKIVFKWVGPQEWESPGFKQALDQIIAAPAE